MPHDGSDRNHRCRNGNDYGHQHWDRNDDRYRHDWQHRHGHDDQSAAHDDAAIESTAASLSRSIEACSLNGKDPRGFRPAGLHVYGLRRSAALR